MEYLNCVQCISCLVKAWTEDHTEISNIADRCLDGLMYGPEKDRRMEIIQLRKFEAYNEAWLERAFTIHEQLNNMDSCWRRSSSGLKQMIEQAPSSDDNSQ